MSKKPWSELRSEEKAEQIIASIFLTSIYYFKNEYEKRKIQAIYCTTNPWVIGKSLYEISKNLDLGIYFRANGLYPYCEDIDRALHAMVVFQYINIGNNEKNQEQYFFTTKIGDIKLFKYMSESVPEEIAKICFEKALEEWKFYCLFK